MSSDSNIPTEGPRNDGGQGELPEVWQDKGHVRQNLRLWRQALSLWPERIQPDMLALIAEAIVRHLGDDDSRVVGNAIRSGLELANYRLKLLEVLDKLERLDAGEATENVAQSIRVVIK